MMVCVCCDQLVVDVLPISAKSWKHLSGTMAILRSRPVGALRVAAGVPGRGGARLCGGIAGLQETTGHHVGSTVLVFV